MAFVWNPFAVPGLAALVVGLALAVFVPLGARRRAQDRRLAFALAVEAVSVGAGFGFGYLASDVPTARIFQTINTDVVRVGPSRVPRVHRDARFSVRPPIAQRASGHRVGRRVHRARRGTR